MIYVSAFKSFVDDLLFGRGSVRIRAEYSARFWTSSPSDAMIWAFNGSSLSVYVEGVVVVVTFK
jgi:hypothetical protein